MQHQDLLQTFAEVAIAIAGFSAVVNAFDRRQDEVDPRLRHYRMRVMVEYSLCVVAFAFAPHLLDALIGSEEVAWRTSSLLLMVVWSTIGLSAAHRARQILGRSPRSAAPAFSSVSTALGYGGAAVLLANALGFPIRSYGASYIFGLFFPLLQSGLHFLRTVVRGDPIHVDPE